MQRIHVLPDIVKSKIAAGEVVGGPASVVKELMENAIDSGATAIDLQITDAGLKKIVCKDNGAGIHADDITLAITEHATSKIRDVYDIEGINTYGFRGEALSSIASISSITILSRMAEQQTGARLFRQEETIDISEYAGPAGTTIIVENLFYNVPARKKFLKQKKTEVRYVREEFLKTALVNPHITFSYEVDGKRTITLPATQELHKRVAQIYGNEVSDGVYHDSLKDLKVTIHGFLSKPTYLKASRNLQVLYINKRPVEYKYFGFILSRAYEAVAIKGKYPIAIMFIDIDPGLVDVNIHPAKKEVKLFDQRYIDGLIYGLAEKVLNKTHAIGHERFSGQETVGTAQPNAVSQPGTINETQPQFNFAGPATPSDRTVSTYNHASQNRPFAGEHSAVAMVKEGAQVYRETTERASLPDIDYRVIGLLFQTYILLEKEGEMQVIDFHAAHERMVFDSLTEKKGENEIQELLFPVMCELPLNDFSIIMENIEHFREIGFDIDEFSDNTITVRSVPVTISKLNIEKILYEFIDTVRHENGPKMTTLETVVATIACHSAKRAGDTMSSSDVHFLVKEIMSGRYELRCPHGRPFVYSMTRNDIERMFKRQ